MLMEKDSFSAVTLDGSVFAIGGYLYQAGEFGDVLDGVEQFNFEKQIWTRYTSLATPRMDHRFIITLAGHYQHILHGAGPSCTRTRCMCWAGQMATPSCAQWSASPQDLLALGLSGIR